MRRKRSIPNFFLRWQQLKSGFAAVRMALAFSVSRGLIVQNSLYIPWKVPFLGLDLRCHRVQVEIKGS